MRSRGARRAGIVSCPACIAESFHSLPHLRWLRGLFARPDPIDSAQWQRIRASVAWIGRLDANRDARLRALTAQFLHRKTITPVAGLTLDADQRCTLAALCCLPLLEFGAEGLHGWSELIVYPDAFRVRRDHIDAAGVLHTGDDALSGEAWDAGPLILSWADVRADIDDPESGCCVAVHEMAHKLDMLDGATGSGRGRGISRALTTHWWWRWTPAATLRSMPMPPRLLKNSSQSAANTTSARRSCCARRCRRSPRICADSMARVRLSVR